MHAVVVDTTVDEAQIDPEYGVLRGQLIPAVRQVAGFVSGCWLAPVGGVARAFVVFESEEAARAAAEGMGVKPGASLAPGTEIKTVDFVEVIGHA